MHEGCRLPVVVITQLTRFDLILFPCLQTFYDLKNKFIAFAATLDPISNITSEWGALFVATTTQRVYQLTEKDLPSKMEMLFRKNLYSIAISLANSQVSTNDVLEMLSVHSLHRRTLSLSRN